MSKEYRCIDCAFIAVKAGKIWCGVSGEDLTENPNRPACDDKFKTPSQITVEDIERLKTLPWNKMR